MTDRLMLLDTASLYYRSFYALPESIRASDGTSVGALRGFVDILSRLVSSYAPETVVACWDDDWRPQWRVDLVPSYKTHRVAEVPTAVPANEGVTLVEEVPDPLEAQIPLIEELLELLGIPVLGAAEHEADDVIGTLATRSERPVDVVTGDRDLFQLIDDARDVRIISTIKGMAKLEVWTDGTVREKYGISAAQYVDFSTMRGDASDGLPGVAGIGEKTAAKLLGEFGSLQAIQSAADQGTGIPAGQAAKIRAAADYIPRALSVVQVVRDLDIDVPRAPLSAPSAGQQERLRAFAERWNCVTAIERLLTILATRA